MKASSKKYAIVIKRNGYMLGEYFVNICESRKSYWSNESKKAAMRFENIDAAMVMYHNIEDWARGFGDEITIVEF